MRVVIGLLACLAASAAHAAKYTLADPNGVPSCDVVVLGVKQQLVYGDMFFEQCDPPKPAIGGSGLETRLGGSSDKVWSFSLSGAETTTMFLFDIKALTWSEYYYGRDGYPIQLIGSGTLPKGNQKTLAPAPAR